MSARCDVSPRCAPRLARRLCGALLPLCLAFVLTACASKVDTSDWRYHCFEDVGVSLLLPGDFAALDAADAVYRGENEELRLTVSVTDELFPGLEALAASVSEHAEREAGIVTVNGVALVAPSAPKGARSVEYDTITPGGGTCRILLSVGEDCKGRRAVAHSLCGRRNGGGDRRTRPHAGGVSGVLPRSRGLNSESLAS